MSVLWIHSRSILSSLRNPCLYTRTLLLPDPPLPATHQSFHRPPSTPTGILLQSSLSCHRSSYSTSTPPPPSHIDPYFLAYEGPLTGELTSAKAVFLACSAGIALLLGYAYEVQRVGIPYGERRSISAQFSIGGLIDGHAVLATVALCYALVAAFFFFLLRRYVTRVYLYRGGNSARFMALREPLFPSNDKIRFEFGLEDIKGRSAVGPFLKDKAFVNSVVAGKPLFIDPNGFCSVADEDAEVRKRALQLAKLIKEET